MLALRLFLALSALLTVSACAQENVLPDAPLSRMPSAVIKPVIQPVHARAEPPRIADKRFWSLTAYDFAMTQVDIATTVFSLNSRTHYCKETFSAAFIGERPSRTKLEVSGVASSVGLSVLGYWLKKRGSAKWWIPQTISGTMHAGAAAWNQFGSGCY
jgi:hypothetical protein